MSLILKTDGYYNSSGSLISAIRFYDDSTAICFAGRSPELDPLVGMTSGQRRDKFIKDNLNRSNNQIWASKCAPCQRGTDPQYQFSLMFQRNVNGNLLNINVPAIGITNQGNLLMTWIVNPGFENMPPQIQVAMQFKEF